MNCFTWNPNKLIVFYFSQVTKGILTIFESLLNKIQSPYSMHQSRMLGLVLLTSGFLIFRIFGDNMTQHYVHYFLITLTSLKQNFLKYILVTPLPHAHKFPFVIPYYIQLPSICQVTFAEIGSKLTWRKYFFPVCV